MEKPFYEEVFLRFENFSVKIACLFFGLINKKLLDYVFAVQIERTGRMCPARQFKLFKG
jgi:hypothetical protein